MCSTTTDGNGMGTPLTDEELLARCREAVEAGTAMTTFHYQLTSEGCACEQYRLRRLWVEAGGSIREKRMLYAPGCGPMDR